MSVLTAPGGRRAFSLYLGDPNKDRSGSGTLLELSRGCSLPFALILSPPGAGNGLGAKEPSVIRYRLVSRSWTHELGQSAG